MDNASIMLHKEKGVNPKICHCTRCGKSYCLIMCGAGDYSAECKACGKVTIGVNKGTRVCPQCKKAGELIIKILPDKDITIGLCDECTKRVEEIDAAMDDDGIAFKCLKCGTEGVILKESKLNAKWRKNALANGLIKDIHDKFGIEVDECAHCHNDDGLGDADV